MFNVTLSQTNIKTSTTDKGAASSFTLLENLCSQFNAENLKCTVQSVENREWAVFSDIRHTSNCILFVICMLEADWLLHLVMQSDRDFSASSFLFLSAHSN